MVCGPCVAQFSQSGLRLGPTRWSRLVDAWVSTEDLAAGRARPILTWTRIGQLAGGWGPPRQARWCRNDPRIGPLWCHGSHRSRLCLWTRSPLPRRRPPVRRQSSNPAASFGWSPPCLSPEINWRALPARGEAPCFCPAASEAEKYATIPNLCLLGDVEISRPGIRVVYQHVCPGASAHEHEHEAGSMEDR